MTTDPAPDETERPPPPLPRDVCFTYEGFQELCDVQKARREALSTALRGMARRSVQARRRATSASRHAQSRFTAYKQLLNKLGSAVGVHVGSPSENRYPEFAERICAAALRHRAELAELKAGRVAGANDVCLCQFGSTCDVCEHSDSTPADRGPLTPHPPPWPVSIDGVLTSQNPGENYDKDCARCGFDRHHHTADDGACQDFEEERDA